MPIAVKHAAVLHCVECGLDVKGVDDESPPFPSCRLVDTQNIKRPGEWDGEKEDFMLWNVLFQAYMATFDRKWKGILNAIETHGKGTTLESQNGEEQKLWIKLDLSGEPKMVAELNETLFITLIQYTTSEIKA